MSIYFTSDTHFGHANIIKYSNRPFADVDEMNEAMIKRWNARVQPNDSIYHLGDFAFMQAEEILRLLDRLNGKKHFIWGNHDKVIQRSSAIQRKFVWCKDYHEMSLPDDSCRGGVRKIVLFHFPIISWNKMHHGAWHLHGHCHHNLRYPFVGRILDAGVDGFNYSPISLEEVRAKMDAVKNPDFLDHHGNKEGME